MKVVFIELANPSRSYFAGQVVQGRVIVQIDKPLKVKEVTVLLEGKGRVSWSESQSYTVYETRVVNGVTQSHPRTHTRMVTFSATEIYISQKISLAGDGHNLIVLPEGTIAYPFQFVLPTNLPSSFTSKVGLVSYLLEAELRRPLLKPNKRNAVPFTVNGIFDLNIEVGATTPQQTQRVKGSNFFACRKGQLGFVLRLPRRSGFVPGEILDFSSEVTNSSNKKVGGMKATLNQITKFYAQGKTKTENKIICELKGPEVEVGDHEMWIPHSMVIPPVPPTRLGGISRIIDVQYVLRFQLSISGLSSSLSGDLPVMIGTIPLRNTFDELRNLPQQMPTMQQPPQQWMPPPPHGSEMGFHVPGAQEGPSHVPTYDKSAQSQDFTSPTAPFLPEYPDLPPPTYAEAVSSEAFTWNAGDADDDTAYNKSAVGNANVDAETLEPSAPCLSEYVPNYITYKSA